MKYELRLMEQNGQVAVVAIADPRIMVQLVDMPDPEMTQESQRPYKESKVKDIAKYVSGKKIISDENSSKKSFGKGFLPGAAIINLLDLDLIEKEKVKVIYSDGSEKVEEKIYLNLPDDKNELKKLKGKIKVIDSQHRLFAFSDRYLDPDFKEDNKYEMIFVMYLNMIKIDMIELFIMINKNQDKVEPNLLRHQKRDLGIAGDVETLIDDLVEQLNNEDSSPLKGRIIISAEKIKRGIKLNQLSKIIDKGEVYTQIKDWDFIQQVKVIINYLNAWRSIFNEAKKDETHILNKVAGHRFMFYMFPSILKTLQIEKKAYSFDNFKEIVKIYKEDILGYNGVLDVFNDESAKYCFRGETSTIATAKEHGRVIEAYLVSKKDDFNPLEGI